MQFEKSKKDLMSDKGSKLVEGSVKEVKMDKAMVGKTKVKHLSSGKMASVKSVTLGTSHGKHSVNHPL